LLSNISETKREACHFFLIVETELKILIQGRTQFYVDRERLLIELLFLLGFVVHTRGLYFRKKERKKEKMEEEERKEAF
jgi:hypothetical protein